MGKRLSTAEWVAVGFGIAVVLAVIIWFSVKPPWHRTSGGDDFHNGSITGVVEDEDTDGRAGGALEERLVPEHAEDGERFGTKLVDGYGLSTQHAYPLNGGERTWRALGPVTLDQQGVLRRDEEELGIVADATDLLAYNEQGVWVLGDNRVLYVTRQEQRIVIDNTDVRTGFLQGGDLVLLTPHYVTWRDAMTGAERAHVLEDANDLCALEDDLCVVGVPTEERVRVYRRGMLLDEVQIVGPLGHTLFGYSVHYQDGVLAVGAPHEGGGAVYLYKWDQVLLAFDRLVPEDTTPRQEFGTSVWVSVDATDILVGSPGYDTKGAVDRITCST